MLRYKLLSGILTAAMTAAFLMGCAPLSQEESLPLPTAKAFTTGQPASATAEPTMVTVFIPDQTASFLSQDSRIAAGTAAQDLMDAFCQAMKITSIPVLSCTDGSELVTLDGEARQALVVSLDLGEAFADYIDGCGSTGEALTITALVNTFLTAMGADCLRLTVAGAVLESGHAVYDSPIVYDAFANTKDSGLLG